MLDLLVSLSRCRKSNRPSPRLSWQRCRSLCLRLSRLFRVKRKASKLPRQHERPYHHLLLHLRLLSPSQAPKVYSLRPTLQLTCNPRQPLPPNWHHRGPALSRRNKFSPYSMHFILRNCDPLCRLLLLRVRTSCLLPISTLPTIILLKFPQSLPLCLPPFAIVTTRFS